MPCRIFNANGVCPRDFMGGCPYKHDWLLWAKTWDHKKRLYVDGFTVINNEIVPNSAIPAVETKFTMITTKVPRQPMTPIVASKFSGMDVKPSACSLAPATTTSVQVKNLTLPQMISNRTTCTSSIASASPLSLKTSFASANDQLVQVKDTASSQINKSSRPFASQLASGSSGMVLSNFHSIQDLSNTSIPWPQPTPKNFSTNVHTAQVKKPALAEAVSNNTKSSAPLAPEDSNIALNGARPVHSMKPFAQSAKNVKKVSSPRHQAHNAQQPKKSTTAPTAPSQSTSLPHLKWEPGLPCLEFAPGPAPGHLRKCTILTVEESIDRKSWDCMPSDWEQFGHAQYSPEDYEKIIAPYMHELERGIVSKEFWYQNLGVSQTNTVSGAATTFLQFGTLPQELQDRIWTYAATDGENTLVIGYHYDSHYTAINHSRIVNEKMIGLSGSPPLLRVCRDARQTTLGLHRHHVVFGANGGPGQHFFNFSKDRLFLHCKLTQEYRHVCTCSSFGQ